MSEPSHFAGRVVVIGGGLSGLAAAHRVREIAPTAEVVLFEAGDRLGGVIATELVDGFLLEQSADSFITNLPWAVDLCRRLGLGDELVATDESRRKAMVVFRGRLEPVPEGFVLMAPTKLGSILSTPVLSLRAKLRLMAEMFVARRKDGQDESLASFARRRLGRETFDRLVQPLVSGIYTADPEKLSVAAALPQFVEMERRHGSLTRGALAARRAARGQAANDSGARYSLFVTLRHGLGTLIEALASQLSGAHIHLNTAARRIERHGERWLVHVDGHEPMACDRLIVATPAAAAARLVSDVDARLAELLAGIPYADAAVALVGFRRQQIAHALDSFGFVVPAIERRRILAGSFSSQKFAGRAPESHVLIRIFLGGATAAGMVERSDEEIKRIVLEELADLIGAQGEPVLFRVTRWRQAMPQYHVGHVTRVDEIESRAAALGLELAGSAYRGVGIPQCIQSGEAAAERAVRASQNSELGSMNDENSA